MDMDALETPLDAALTRFAGTSPIIPPGLSNHGPMVVEVLDFVGRREVIAGWTDSYLRILAPKPDSPQPIEADEWTAALGDHDRLGDWMAFFEGQFARAHWELVLRGWLPRLMPGIKTELGHGPIRTFHAVRGLRRVDNEVRRRELAMALAFWAAWYEESPHGRHAPADPSEAESALDGMIEAGARWFLHRMDLDPPVVLAHAVTIPRAVRALLPWLNEDDRGRAASLMAGAYLELGYGHAEKAEPPIDPSNAAFGQLLDQAIRNGDPHAIKFTEACQEQFGRTGAAVFLAAAHAAGTRLTTQSALFV